MRNVEGKVAFITGGASGIGLGMAEAFLAAGMKVVIGDFMQQHLDEVAGKLKGNNAVHLIRLDVTDREAMTAAADETERLFGKVHVLCNNVGVSQRNSIDEASYADWDYVLNACVGGTVNGLVTFLPRIKAHGEGGHVVNTSSMAGMIPVPGFAGIYATAKYGIRGMSDSLRLALGPHKIGVSVLCPGHVRSRAMTSGAQYRKLAETGAEAETAPPTEGGMDARKVGELVLKAIQNNELYIFPHGEFKEECRAYFDEMLAAFPPDDPTDDPVRHANERRRMQMTREARELSDRLPQEV